MLKLKYLPWLLCLLVLAAFTSSAQAASTHFIGDVQIRAFPIQA